MTEDQFKEKVQKVIGDQQVKVWLTRVSGHRLDFSLSIGKAQLVQEETLANRGPYFLVAQNADAEMKSKLIEIFTEYCESDYVKQNTPPARSIRFIIKE